MKFVTLKSFNKKKLLIPTLIITSLILVITIFISHAEFISTDHVTIVDGVINYTPYDFKMMAMYEQKEGCEDSSSYACYTEIDVMPSEGYEINQEKSYCFVDDDNDKLKGYIYTNSDGEYVIKELPKRSKCIIYFDKKKEDLGKKTYEQLLALNPELESKGNEAHFDGSSCDSGCDYQENGVYEAEDENGTTSYYFRGTVENNYVKFGKTNVDGPWYYSDGRWTSFYESQQNCENAYADGCKKLYSPNEDIWWRIIRINGDGSIRMIYAGTSTDGLVPEQTGIGTVIGNGEFNFYNEIIESVGYQYTDGERNGHSEDSNAKTEIDKWFTENLLDEYNASDSKIDRQAGFCGDRITYRYENDEYIRDDRLGIEDIIYGGAVRDVLHKPTFLCEDKEHDLYTTKEANEGTSSLTYPIGMITIDEEIYAGSEKYGGIVNNYLNNNIDYWTMSPSGTNLLFGSVLYMEMYSHSQSSSVESKGVNDSSSHFRPVINLRPNSLTKGDGTAGNPYTIG